MVETVRRSADEAEGQHFAARVTSMILRQQKEEAKVKAGTAVVEDDEDEAEPFPPPPLPAIVRTSRGE